MTPVRMVVPVCAALLGSVSLAAGCSDDDPSEPGPGGSGGVAGSTASGGGGDGGTGGTGGTGGSGGSGGGATACDSGTVVFQSDFEDQSLADMWVDGDATITQEQIYAGG